ncbi:MAG: hypothetical protein PVJ57_11870, partial [Phycisphaerae bacterium]
DAEWREASAGRDRQRPLHRRRKTRESRRLITTPSTTFDNSSRAIRAKTRQNATDSTNLSRRFVTKHLRVLY